MVLRHAPFNGQSFSIRAFSTTDSEDYYSEDEELNVLEDDELNIAESSARSRLERIGETDFSPVSGDGDDLATMSGDEETSESFHVAPQRAYADYTEAEMVEQGYYGFGRLIKRHFSEAGDEVNNDLIMEAYR